MNGWQGVPITKNRGNQGEHWVAMKCKGTIKRGQGSANWGYKSKRTGFQGGVKGV